MITLWADTLVQYRSAEACLNLPFHRWDNGDAYTQANVGEDARYTVPGVLYISHAGKPVDISKIGKSKDWVRVLASWRPQSSKNGADESVPSGAWKIQGSVRADDGWQEMPVQIIPLRDDLFSRAQGLLASDLLCDVYVFVAGLGSVGSFVAEELAKAGIVNYILLDFDRVEVGNVVRQNAGVCDVGRYKTKVATGKIHNKNPYANVETHELKITWDNQEIVRGLIRQSEFVIGSVDKPEPRKVLSKLCVEEGKPLILVGAMHLGCGLQILFRRNKSDPCYICFLMQLPAEGRGSWTSSLEQPQPTPYADHPVEKAEPGLSADIMPMIVMTVRLCLNYLLRGKPTSLQSLDDDLVAPFYVYANRREPGTEFESLEPLGFNAGNGKVHILSWQGRPLERNPACPVCGDFVGQMSKLHGISISEADKRKYGYQADK